jgi:hypothetical protein
MGARPFLYSVHYYMYYLSYNLRIYSFSSTLSIYILIYTYYFFNSIIL